jgi:hypothetical protein
MKPDKEGIWEWFDDDGTKRLVSVFNVESNPSFPPYLRVSWWGGYYSIDDEPNLGFKTEWPDRWGNYVGPVDSVKEYDLYWMPTPEQMEKIMKQHENKI